MLYGRCLVRATLSGCFVSMALMSEMPAGDTHDVIHHRGEVVAVAVPVAEYQRLRQAAQEQRVNEEFDDPAGVTALWNRVSQLADEPRPTESFPYGSPDIRRLRAGRYRVFYQIDDDTQVIQIDHVGRI
jgi:mRNA interferase RelE/StbE